MPRAVTGEELRSAVVDQTFIKRGDPRCVEGMKYDFRLGSRILKASFNAPIDLTLITELERSKVAVEPGEVVFVLTEERLELPNDMKAELSPKRKLSHEGILVLGGFGIDPRYSGNLLVGLYNFSSTPFPLMMGRKLIAALFYRLEGPELAEFPLPDSIETFPDELTRLIRDYRPVAPQALHETFAALRAEVANLRQEFVSGRDWQRQFQESLTRHDKQIEDLLSGLRTEQQTRQRGEDKMTDAVNEMKGTLSWIKGAAWVVAIMIGFFGTGILGPLVYSYITAPKAPITAPAPPTTPPPAPTTPSVPKTP